MRPTKLSVFCDYVIEAGWLTAVITTPLFFNVYSSRVFEPDKLTLLRSIALFMALTWVVKVLDAGLGVLEDEARPRGRSRPSSNLSDQLAGIAQLIRNTPLVLPTLMLVAVYILSTITSVAPRLSFWGSYQRLQGTYTTLAYIIVFLLLLQGLRTREQLDRLITATILASLPVALYGLIQHYGLDPLPWLGDVQTRVSSSMGNPIFVAAYLIMVVPLTLLRLLEGFADLMEAEDDVVSPFVEATGYLFIFLAQLLAIFFSQSRGPWLGLMGGMFVFGLLWAVTRSNRRLVFGIIGIAVLGAAFLVVLNLPNTPLEPVRDMPYIGRLGRVFETETGTGRVRVLIWEGAIDLITADPLRATVGYGPETMHVAYNPHYPPDLAHYEARNASPDRSHNETFDALVITGVVGFGVYLFLFISLFYFGLKWLGLVKSVAQRNLLVALIIVAGLLAVVGFRIADGTNRFFGVALPAGMIVGLFIYLIWATLSRSLAKIRALSSDNPYRLTLIALLAAVIGHFVEIHLGIAIAATRILFWSFAALMVVLGYLVHQRPALIAQADSTPRPAPARSKKGRSRGNRRQANEYGAAWPWKPALTVTGISSIILVTVAYNFITNPARESSALSIIWHTLFAKWENNQFVTSPATMWLIGLVWLLTGLLGLAMIKRGWLDNNSNQRHASADHGVGWWGRAFVLYSALSLAVFVFFGLIIAAHLSPQTNVTLNQAVDRLASHVTLYYIGLFTAVIALGAILTWRGSTPHAWWSGRWPVLLSPILALLTFVIIGNTNLDVVQADVYYKQAWNGYHSRGQYDAAIATYRRALELQPEEDYYYLFLGKAYLEQVRTAQDQAERERLLEASRQALERAQELNPLNPDHAANLARLHQQWAQMAQDPERRQELQQKALEHHRHATTLAPNAAHLYNEWAMTLDQMGQYDAALEKLEKSTSLDPIYADTFVFMGQVYQHAGQIEQAISAYEKAQELDPDRGEAYQGLAALYEQQGQIDKAIEETLALAEQRPNNATARRNLAVLYVQQGDLDAAQREAEAAAQLAGNNPAVQILLADIYRIQGQTQRAIDVYQQVLSERPQSTDAYRGLALAYDAQGNVSAALDTARQALSLAPNSQSLQTLVESLENRNQ